MRGSMRCVLGVVVLGVCAGTAMTLPDPPAGRYDMGFQESGGGSGLPPLGEPLLYADLVQLPDDSWAWGVVAHGWVELPAPAAGGQNYWRSRHDPYNHWVGANPPEYPSTPNPTNVFGPVNWNGAGTAYWAVEVWNGWGTNPTTFDMPTGNVTTYFRTEIKGPTTGGAWLNVANLWGYFSW